MIVQLLCANAQVGLGNTNAKNVCPAADSEGGQGFSRTPIGSKFHFHEIFLMGYRIYPQYSYPYCVPYTSLQQINITYYECV